MHELVTLVAKNAATVMPTEWLWKQKHHAKLVDGFTATMPDPLMKIPRQKLKQIEMRKLS